MSDIHTDKKNVSKLQISTSMCLASSKKKKKTKLARTTHGAKKIGGLLTGYRSDYTEEKVTTRVP